MRILSGVMTQ